MGPNSMPWSLDFKSQLESVGSFESCAVVTVVPRQGLAKKLNAMILRSVILLFAGLDSNRDCSCKHCFEVAVKVLLSIGVVSCLAVATVWGVSRQTPSEDNRVAPQLLRSVVLQEESEVDNVDGADGADGSAESTTGGIGLEAAFPKLRFDRPVHLCAVGDNRVFVVEQAGVVHVFDNDPEVSNTKIFLDLSDRVDRGSNEEGLIGFAFHPDFKNNGQFFVHYSTTVKKQVGVLARYHLDEDDPTIGDPDSEEIILEQEQPYRNHNGGTIAFGHDGMLYLSFGDGGSLRDPHEHGQNLGNILGTIIRINVDKTDEGLAYSIPADNPFVNDADVRDEIYACGLRNVWRFSVDRKTGEIWAGDVGQDRFDEIDLIKSGANYGWNHWEAGTKFREETKMATPEHEAPIAEYGREWGLSVTGGNVYRGKRFPELDGSYFYGDYITGNLWRIITDENGEYKSELVRRTGRSIAAFGEDSDGEVFLLSFDGGIYRIVPTAEPENFLEDWPKNLKDSGIFANVGQKKMSEQYVKYEVNAPFWSDGADKSRYVKLPEGESMTFAEKGSWSVPVGTEIVKNFQDPGTKRMLETRVIKRTDGGWEAATYVWDNKSRGAKLYPQGKQFEMWSRPGVLIWHGPSSSECASCHTDASGYVLGLNTAQLNDQPGEENQIARLAKAGLLSGLPEGFETESAMRFCNPHDEEADLETRARVMLDVNCAMCHLPNGSGNANIDLRYATPLAETKMIDVAPQQGDLGVTDGKIVAPGDAEKSLLYYRVNTRSNGRMPNVGSSAVDTKSAALLKEWIESLGASE